MQLLEQGPSSSQTDWTLINEAGQLDTEAASDALERMVRRYWPAVYAFVRSAGKDVHESSDLTQGFICDVIISRRLCATADPQRGRFRSLLLGSLKNYMRENDRRKARKRSSGREIGTIRLDEAEAIVTRTQPKPNQTPDQVFSYQWSSILIHRVLDQVRTDCLDQGMEAHWSVFEKRVVRPMLLGEPATDYTHLVERYEIKDVSQAANMMVTVKRRFVAALYQEVARTVANVADVDDELRQLLRDLEQPV